MSAFSDFMVAFEKWKSDNDLVITPQNRTEYAFKIGANARNEFQKHLDDFSTEDFDAETLARFKNMFLKDNELTGINVLSNPVGEHANKVYLYHAKPKNGTAEVKDVTFKTKTKLYNKSLLNDPMGGKLSWKYGLKPSSVKIKDSVNVYVDERGQDCKGTFMGEDRGVTVSGTVDYCSCEVVINRLSDENVKKSMQYEVDYNTIVGMTMGTGESSSSDAGSSSSSSSSSGEPPTIGNSLGYKNYYLDRDNFSFQYTAYGEPVKVLWEYDITDAKGDKE